MLCLGVWRVRRGGGVKVKVHSRELAKFRLTADFATSSAIDNYIEKLDTTCDGMSGFSTPMTSASIDRHVPPPPI